MSIDFNRNGRMISGTKSGYKGRAIFNANVCTKSKGKIWYGDLDLDGDAADLQSLADREREAVYVLRESDARFQNEAAPLFDKAVTIIPPTAVGLN